jgi:segregation and condensation protein A
MDAASIRPSARAGGISGSTVVRGATSAETPRMSFRVSLEIYRGPLDLLLYLVRKHEIDITNIPIALITDQFLQHLAVLEQLDVNAVGDFLEMASTLIEIKSRMVLPHSGEQDEPLEDPRQELVQRLLEYKKYKDAASLLEDRSRQWQDHIARVANDVPPRQVDLADQPIREVEMWDLVSAFGRIVRDSAATQTASIVYDDTPIHVYMRQIHGRLVEDSRVGFSQMFAPGMHKSALIGVFLAVLELVRHHSVRAEQGDLHSEIWILPGPEFKSTLELADVDEYGGKRAPEPDESALEQATVDDGEDVE